jgi:hypothetical protein
VKERKEKREREGEKNCLVCRSAVRESLKA